MHVLIKGVGVDKTQGRWDPIWLRITNETEYRGWNVRLNGVKRVDDGEKVGFFGVINLLGPRTTLQRPFDKYWSDQFTIDDSRARSSSAAWSLRPLEWAAAPVYQHEPSRCLRVKEDV